MTVSKYLDKQLDSTLPDFNISVSIHTAGTSSLIHIETPPWYDEDRLYDVRTPRKTTDIFLTEVVEDGAVKMRWDKGEEDGSEDEDEEDDGAADDEDSDDDKNGNGKGQGKGDECSKYDSDIQEDPPAKRQKLGDANAPIEIDDSDDERDRDEREAVDAVMDMSTKGLSGRGLAEATQDWKGGILGSLDSSTVPPLLFTPNEEAKGKGQIDQTPSSSSTPKASASGMRIEEIQTVSSVSATKSAAKGKGRLLGAIGESIVTVVMLREADTFSAEADECI